MAVGQNQWYHLGVGVPPIRTDLSGWIGMYPPGVTDLDFEPWYLGSPLKYSFPCAVSKARSRDLLTPHVNLDSSGGLAARGSRWMKGPGRGQKWGRGQGSTFEYPIDLNPAFPVFWGEGTNSGFKSTLG